MKLLCYQGFLLFLPFSILSKNARFYFKESLDCILNKKSSKKCEVIFDTKIKGMVVGIILKLSSKLARNIRTHFNIIFNIFFLIYILLIIKILIYLL